MTPETLNIALLGETQVEMDETMPGSNVTYTPVNSITVTQTGIYEVNYQLIASVALAATMNLSVRVNGTIVPESFISRLLALGASEFYQGSIIINLNAGDVVDMALSASIAVGVTLGGGTNASLTVKMLNS